MNSNCIQTLKKMAAALLLALVLLTSTQLPARADDMAAENIILTVGAGDMLMDGATVSVADGVPVLNGGRVYVPLRAVAEGFGAEVNYDAATGDVTIEEGDTEVIMNTLASIYSVNGNLKWMDMPTVAPWCQCASFLTGSATPSTPARTKMVTPQ